VVHSSVVVVAAVVAVGQLDWLICECVVVRQKHPEVKMEDRDFALQVESKGR